MRRTFPTSPFPGWKAPGADGSACIARYMEAVVAGMKRAVLGCCAESWRFVISGFMLLFFFLGTIEPLTLIIQSAITLDTLHVFVVKRASYIRVGFM